MKERRTAPNWPKEDPITKGFFATQKQKYIPRMMKHVIGCDIEEEEIMWLWSPYIPRGKVTLIEGDPGIGKSWTTCMIAKAVAEGSFLPGQSVGFPPAKVLLCSAEDGIADTQVPRLNQLGTSRDAMSRIIFIDEIFQLNYNGVQDLKHIIEEYSISVVFIDPIQAYLDTKMDMNKTNEVRALMTILAEVAYDTGCAIVAIRHLRKSGAGQSNKEIYAGSGSIDWTASARSVIAITTARDGQPIIKHIKSNLKPKGPVLAYNLDDNAEFGISPFTWVTDYAELPEDVREPKISTTRKREDCADFIFDLLKDGEKSATEMRAICLKEGYKMGTIKNSKKERNVLSKKLGNGDWVWYLKDREGISK